LIAQAGGNVPNQKYHMEMNKANTDGREERFRADWESSKIPLGKGFLGGVLLEVSWTSGIVGKEDSLGRTPPGRT